MPTPRELADALLDLTASHAKANAGSSSHVLGKARVGPLQEIVPQAAAMAGVLQGYGIRFEDGSTYLVNVHLIPATAPASPSPTHEPPSKPPPQGA